MLKVVKEFERGVIMRLGRILPGGARGPGLFFILPCIDHIITIDLRTITFDVAPQEVKNVFPLAKKQKLFGEPETSI